jgi:manganese-dependent inorganic pyrophosphatase
MQHFFIQYIYIMYREKEKQNPLIKDNRGNNNIKELFSTIKKSIHDNKKLVDSFLKKKASPSIIKKNDWRYNTLKGCLFVGHLKTDLDSIAGAIGAANLFSGIACKSENKLNTEIKWALKKWGYKEDDLIFIDSVKNLSKKKVCLVDHSSKTQTPKCININQIVGVIDHHKIEIQTSVPILCDIRPWGCMSSILVYIYIKNFKEIPKKVGGILLSAILSDTLNLKSVTTTEYDKMAVTYLSNICNIKDIDNYAQDQFKAKSKMIELYSISELVLGDEKEFSFPNDNGKFGWATLECITESIPLILKIKNELLNECRAIKKDNKLNFIFLSVVDIIKRNTILFICDDLEVDIAKKAFDNKVKDNLLYLDGFVSRKKQFVPAIEKVLKDKKYVNYIIDTSDKIREMRKKIDFGVLFFDKTKGNDGQLIRKIE